MKAVVIGPFDMKRASEAVPRLNLIQVHNETDLFEKSHDADIILQMNLGWIRNGFPALLKASPKLKWFHCSSAGVDPLICQELIDSGVSLTCAKGLTIGPLLAEHAFALMLSLTRGLVEPISTKHWNSQSISAQGAYELGGKTIGLVGFGGTGKELAIRAQSFGMTVIAIRRSPDLKSNFTEWGPDRLFDMLEVADFVVISVPETPETRHMFNSEAFLKMKDTAILINVGRGKTVETNALLKALSEKQIFGAGLDVIDPEPLPESHPMWEMDNVVITPHIAGNSRERAQRNETVVIENLKRFYNGLPLQNTVDVNLGY